MESSSSSSSSSTIAAAVVVVRRQRKEGLRLSQAEGRGLRKGRGDGGELGDGIHVDRERVGSISCPEKTAPVSLLSRRRGLRRRTRSIERISSSVAGREAHRTLLLLIRRLSRVRERVVVSERREGREIGNGVGVKRGEVVLLAEDLREVLVGTLERATRSKEKKGEGDECLLVRLGSGEKMERKNYSRSIDVQPRNTHPRLKDTLKSGLSSEIA